MNISTIGNGGSTPMAGYYTTVTPGLYWIWSKKHDGTHPGTPVSCMHQDQMVPAQPYLAILIIPHANELQWKLQWSHFNLFILAPVQLVTASHGSSTGYVPQATHDQPVTLSFMTSQTHGLSNTFMPLSQFKNFSISSSVGIWSGSVMDLSTQNVRLAQWAGVLLLNRAKSYLKEAA